MSGDSIRTSLIFRAKSAAAAPLDYSDYVAKKRTVGVSSNVFDIQNTPGANVDLAFIYSNGYRYQYLAFKAQFAGLTGLTGGITSCGIATDYVTIIEPVYDEDGLPTGELIGVDRDPTVITYAYVGTPVVPQAPPNNTPTNGLLPPSKIPYVPTKIGC